MKLVGAVALVAACAAPSPSNATLSELDSDAAPLESWFDAQRAHPRAVLLLSPT